MHSNVCDIYYASAGLQQVTKLLRTCSSCVKRTEKPDCTAMLNTSPIMWHLSSHESPSNAPSVGNNKIQLAHKS